MTAADSRLIDITRGPVAGLPLIPQTIDPEASFEQLVDWIHQEIFINRGAPGLVIGISGTDSILAFLAAAKAAERAGKADRVAGLHFGEQLPPAEQLEQIVQRESEAFWFQRQVIPWLREQAPQAQVIIDDSIDYKRDGVRWGALMDWSVVQNPATGELRPYEESYWVVGTRNMTEDALRTYSNLSTAVSLQPLVGLWKSEVLQLCEALDVPQKAMLQSRQADCFCGRMELPATHIELIDALLMIRRGELDPSFAQTIPPLLLTQLNQFIDTQLQGSRFKDQIPYLPSREQTVNIAPSRAETVLFDQPGALQAADSRTISELVPDILHNRLANAAATLVCTGSTNRESWLAEAFMLLGTPELTLPQRQQMVKAIFEPAKTNHLLAGRLADTSARIAQYGFSFPRWRFLSQQAGEHPSLVEQFGMERLYRDTDVRDASLPYADPNRDLFGPGFVWQDDTWYVEYRRGYLCISRSGEEPATLVIRNNSYFFGRDRMADPVYVSLEPISREELQNLTAESLRDRFIAWQDIARTGGTDLKTAAAHIGTLVDYLDGFEANLNQWLQNAEPSPKPQAGPDHSADQAGGLAALTQFLEQRAAQPTRNGKPPMYLGAQNPHSAPWFPQSVMALTPDALHPSEDGTSPLTQLLKHIRQSGSELLLLSGPNGDFPVIDQPKSWVKQIESQKKSDIAPPPPGP